MSALLKDPSWFATRLEQERAAAKTLGEVAAMLDQAAKEAALDAVCKAHARRLYDAVTDPEVRAVINMIWARANATGPFHTLVNVIADIEAEAS